MRHGPTRAWLTTWLTPWRKKCRCGCAWYPCPDAVKVEQPDDPLWHVTARVADCIAERGYAFVEDDKVGALAAALRSFLTAAGVPINAREIEGAEAGSLATWTESSLAHSMKDDGGDGHEGRPKP